MRTPSFLARTPVDVPDRSGFSMPHEYLTTGRCGTLIPVMCKRMVPGETQSLNIMFEAELPPMVSNFFGRLDLCFEAFFVPNYLLWGGWDDFFMHPTNNPIYPEGTNVAAKPHNIPHIVCEVLADGTGQERLDSLIGRNTLGDFLGIKALNYSDGNNRSVNISVNALPFMAYHRVYHDHYRNSVVQSPLFYKPLTGAVDFETGIYNEYPAILPYNSGVLSDVEVGDNVLDIPIGALGADSAIPLTPESMFKFGDGVAITSLRQANFDLDYFTAATPQPQAGGTSTLTFDVAVDPESGDGTGSFSIAALRSVNAIQQWMERNNLVGYDYGEQNYVQYGRYPKRMLDKCVYIGRYSEPVYNRSIFQTAQDGESGNTSRNPFGGVAAKFGASAANGKGRMFEDFVASDHGYLMVMMSLRPHAYYSTGVERHLTARHIGDIPFPLLSGVGDMPIYNYELMGFGTDANTQAISNSVFGYIDQYANDKTALDSVHGELRDGGILDAFALQRSFSPADGTTTISDAFLEIPVDYLDQVKQVQNSLVPIDYWVSVFLDFNKISPLPVYSVPTLADLKHTHTVHVSRKKSTV